MIYKNTIVELAEAVHSGKRSAVETTQYALDNIKKHNEAVNAFVYLDEGNALNRAREIDQQIAKGIDPGPLAGVPFGIKDLKDTCIGMPTRNGSLFYQDAPAALEDTIHIKRLKEAGAIPLGKVATAEFGMDGVTHTLAHGTTRNPWSLDRTPSGSSGGSSAAVAANLVPFCTAGDGGGSIRCPAGYTGMVGLKPSMGRIPRPDGFNNKSCPGAITRTVQDTARYLDVVCGPDDYDHMTFPAPAYKYETLIETLETRGLKAVWSSDLGYAPVAPDVEKICHGAALNLIDAAGMELNDHKLSLPNAYMDINMQLCELFIQDLTLQGILPDNINKLSPGPRWFVEKFYRDFTPEVRLHAIAKQKQIEKIMADLFSRVDVLITPCHSRDAYAAEGPLPEIINGMDASETHAEPFTMLANICWNPSISIPAGLSDDGLPIGLLLTTRRHRDDVALRLARIMEQTRPWPLSAPGYK